MEHESQLTENGKKTRDKIFEAAVELLKTDGYDKLTIRKICAKSGTSNGSFYHFFKSKDELLAYYYNLSAEQFTKECVSKMEGADLYHQMLICYEWYIRYSADYGVDFCMNFFTPGNRAIDPDYTYNAFYEISRQYLHKQEDKIKPGRTSDQVAKELCFLAKGIIFNWSNERGAFDINAAAESMFSAYLDGAIFHE